MTHDPGYDINHVVTFMKLWSESETNKFVSTSLFLFCRTLTTSPASVFFFYISHNLHTCKRPLTLLMNIYEDIIQISSDEKFLLHLLICSCCLDVMSFTEIKLLNQSLSKLNLHEHVTQKKLHKNSKVLMWSLNKRICMQASRSSDDPPHIWVSVTAAVQSHKGCCPSSFRLTSNLWSLTRWNVWKTFRAECREADGNRLFIYSASVFCRFVGFFCTFTLLLSPAPKLICDQVKKKKR